MNSLRTVTLAALLLAASPANHATAHEADAQTVAATEASIATRPGTRDPLAYFTDTLLVDQRGRMLRFYSDVLKDKVVLLNVVFSNCEDACPLITSKLVEVSEKLGEQFGREVFFVSISTDPELDSPAALRKFAATQRADRTGWSFLTGDKPAVDLVLARLGQLSAQRESHSTLLIAGNVGGKRWSKIQPQAPAWAIAERLKLLAEAPAEPGRAARR